MVFFGNDENLALVGQRQRDYLGLDPAETLGRALGLTAVDALAKPLELATLRRALGLAA